LISLLFYCCLFQLAAILLNIGVPIALLLGPLVQRTYFRQHGLPHNSKVTDIHLIPFYFFSAVYLIWCLASLAGVADIAAFFSRHYYPTYLWATSFSLLAYSLSILLVRIKEDFEFYELEDRVLDMLLFLSLAVSFPLVMSSINQVVEFNWGFQLEVLIDGILVFAIVVMAYYLFAANLFLAPEFSGLSGELTESQLGGNLSETLSETSTNAEVQKIYDCLTESKLYLKPVSLDMLAEQVSMPKHICSKLLNEEIGKSFYQLIAEYRIEYAISLMESDANKRYTIEWLAHASGFSSKTSFNRYFKAYKGCVPSQYQKK